MVVNPYATTVSNRLKHLVVYALQSRYEVIAVDTERQNHATEIARRAAQEGVELVVAFGGDGTVNEVANGLVGSDVPLSVLPGGSTNVFCRTLGIPNDIVKATERLLRLDDRNLAPRRIDLGRVNGRYFTFGSGVGLDASAVKQVDANPWLKGRLGEYYYAYWLVRAFHADYLGKKPLFRVEQDGEQRHRGIAAIVQNCMPYAYFGKNRLDVCDDVSLDSGTLSYAVLEKARQVDLPMLAQRLLATRAKTTGHRLVNHVEGLTDFRIEAQPPIEGGKFEVFPLHVDGDYIGDFKHAHFTAHPRALGVIL